MAYLCHLNCGPMPDKPPSETSDITSHFILVHLK